MLSRRSLRELFDAHDGRMIHKHEHYFPIYERHFERFRGTRPHILEVGVQHGGSLELWSAYFGRGTSLVGLDIDPRCAEHRIPGATIVIGDQGDRAVLERIVDEHGPFDIVIEDGSHLPEHQLLAFDVLWPAVRLGGVYLVEDLHTNYWDEYGGAPGGPDTFIEHAKGMLDRINAHNSRDERLVVDDFTRTCGGFHVYDSVIVFDRADTARISTVRAGRPVFDIELELSRSDDAHLARVDELNRTSRRIRRALRSPRRTLSEARRRLRDRFTR